MTQKKGITVSTDRERAIFSRLEAKFKAEGKIVTPGYIRLENELINGKPKYDFQILRDTNSDSVTEQKLDRNDKFLATHLGLFLIHRGGTIPNSDPEEKYEPGLEVLQTYPNPTIFSDKSIFLESIYNGKISIMVGQTKYVEALDTRRFRYVPTAQQLTVTNGASSTPLVVSSIANSGQDENSGFINLTPQITFDGALKNNITLEAPIASTFEMQPSQRRNQRQMYCLVLMMRGFLVTNR